MVKVTIRHSKSKNIRIRITHVRTPNPPLCTKVCFAAPRSSNFKEQKPTIMKQFFCYWRKYVRLTAEAETQLLRGSKLRSYRANEQLTINHACMKVYPEVACLTPRSFQIDFMAISQSAYYRAKKRYG